VRQDQAALLAVLEGLDASDCIAEDEVRTGGSAISDPQPDYLRQSPEQQASLREIRVFRNDHETILKSIAPHLIVGSSAQAAIPKVERSGVEITKRRSKAWREILIEQQFHKGTMASLRSASAA
jgi:hypothetical protein